MQVHEGRSRRWPLMLGLVFLVALVARAGHVIGFLRSAAGDTQVLDARYYHRQALHILGSLPDGADGVSFMNVGYPYALAAIYSAFGSRVAAAMAIQAILGALSALLLALAARDILKNDRAAILAGLLYACYQQAVFYDGLLLTTSIASFLLAAALLATVRAQTKESPRWAAAAGLAVGLATLQRSNLLLCVPVLAAILLFADRRPLGARFRVTLAFLAVAMFVPGVVVVRNGVVAGTWVPVTANAGMNFWVGNNRDARGVYYVAPFLESEDAEAEERGFLEEARRRGGDRALSLGSSSNWWLREGLREIRAAPSNWVVLEVRKVALFWTRFEPKTNVSMEFVRNLSPWLRAVPIGFGILAILGIGGIVLLAAEGHGVAAATASALVLVSWATCLLFFVSGEYRHAASLGLALGAAALLDGGARWIARHRAGREAGTSPGTTAPAVGSLVYALAIAGIASPLVLSKPPVLIASSHPMLDFSNYAREITAPRLDGSPRTRADFDRAAALLDRAPSGAGGELLLLEAQLRVHCRAVAALDGDPHASARAREVVRELATWDLRPGLPGYTDAFVIQVRDLLEECTGSLARRDVEGRTASP